MSKGLHGWKSDIIGTEERQESWIHLISSPSSLKGVREGEREREQLKKKKSENV